MKCPGQDSRYWKPGAIFEAKCPKCGDDVECFKDDTTRPCKKCGHRFLNPGLDFGCASYCQYAEQCIGNLPPELMAQKENLSKLYFKPAVSAVSEPRGFAPIGILECRRSP